MPRPVSTDAPAASGRRASAPPAQLSLLAPSTSKPSPPALLEFSRAVLRPLGQSPAAHHRLIIAALTDVAEGATDRLMLLMPPGSAKSTYASVHFPAWYLARHPNASVIAASHTASLAEHFGRRARGCALEHAGLLGYGVDRGHRAVGSWASDAGGEYFATGVRGPVTGRRADLIVIDDPVKNSLEADSALNRDQLWEWYRSDLSTRLKPQGRIVLVMTRWHIDDIGGRLLAADEKWRVIRLPAIAEGPVPGEPPDPMSRAEGEALWPEWENLEKLAGKRAVLGPRGFAALFQQRPTPDGGALFRVAAISVLPSAPAEARCVRAWDLAATAATDGRDPDWTVGLKLAREAGGRVVVADVVRLRGGPHEVEQAIVNTAAQDGRAVPVGLPQDPGQAGKQQVAWLTSRLAGHRVIASPETGSKALRAAPVAAQADAGNLALVAAPWNRAFLDELRDFPLGRKDDQVDALSRAFAMLSEAQAAPARRVHLPFMGR